MHAREGLHQLKQLLLDDSLLFLLQFAIGCMQALFLFSMSLQVNKVILIFCQNALGSFLCRYIAQLQSEQNDQT